MNNEQENNTQQPADQPALRSEFSISGRQYSLKPELTTGEIAKLTKLFKPLIAELRAELKDKTEDVAAVATEVILYILENDLLPAVLLIILKDYQPAELFESDLPEINEAVTTFFLSRLLKSNHYSAQWQTLTKSSSGKVNEPGV